MRTRFSISWWFASGSKEPEEKSWEPEPFELPAAPANTNPSRKPPQPDSDEDDDQRPGSRVIVIDLA
jgi:hypothetical protein